MRSHVCCNSETILDPCWHFRSLSFNSIWHLRTCLFTLWNINLMYEFFFIKYPVLVLNINKTQAHCKSYNKMPLYTKGKGKYTLFGWSYFLFFTAHIWNSVRHIFIKDTMMCSKITDWSAWLAIHLYLNFLEGHLTQLLLLSLPYFFGYKTEVFSF